MPAKAEAPAETASQAPTEAWIIVAGIGACLAMLLIFGAVSYTAALSKSATYDEPLHVVSGYVHRVLGDYRLDPEDPALFGYWAAIPHGASALPLNLKTPFWPETLLDSRNFQWIFCVPALFRTPGVNGDLFLQESRLMFTLIGIALGGFICWWAWQIGGVWSGAFATALIAFDANFMAHSSLVKNDVMLAMTMTAMVIALWRFGRRGTLLSFIAMSLATAAAVNVKFSGVLCGPIIFVCLLIRALLPQDWIVIGRTYTTRGRRLLLVPILCAIVGIISYVSIWACYGFRYSPASDPLGLLDDGPVIQRVKQGLAGRHIPIEKMTQADVDAEPLNGTAKAIVWLEGSHILPQAWAYGFLFTYASTLQRSAFLMGQTSSSGWWYYFPCTMLFKTPTPTLLAMLLGLIGIIAVLLSAAGRKLLQAHTWTIACLALPVIFYAASAMSSNLNLGLRHILPVYPFIFVALGIGMAAAIHRWGHRAIIGGGVLVALLAIETLSAFPNFIPFFNTPSELIAGGFNLLGDSNLDWGQDLKLLHTFQQQHPEHLYLDYFGVADPKAYGVSATYTPGGWQLQQFIDPAIPTGLPQRGENCYVAISATNLQGIYSGAGFGILLDYKPAAILGKSIYVYKFPLSPDDKKTH